MTDYIQQQTGRDEQPDTPAENRPVDPAPDRTVDAAPDRPVEGSGAGEEPVPLLAANELQSVITRWREIQAEFVDDPRHAVQDADTLVSDLMRRLAQTFADQRDHLESQWSGGDGVSTEDLRQNLQRYRSFFDRLLAA